ncbi:MAG: NAD-dependent epimerase/dehydratase family protein [Deltaproteobacteria bacterium]|nr:NAD-dependent epimerase/dehydratase family protein [Deltaproteobacteria bacterium]
MRSIAVLGGGGFLGSHFVRGLLQQTNLEVEVVDTCFTKLESAPLPRAARLTRACVTQQGLIERVVEEHETIVSMTAICTPANYNKEPLAVIDASYTDLVPLVQRCSEKKRYLIHLSTCEVYGKAESEALNETSSPLLLGPIPAERWSYACAKQLLERVIWAHMTHHGLEATIIRPFNVIGPQMDYLPGFDGEGTPRVLANFMHALLCGEALPLVDGGAQRRAFLYVDDFTEALLGLLRCPEARGEIINLGNPENDISIAELAAQMIAAYSKHQGPKASTPELVSADSFYGAGYDDVKRRVPDIHKASALLQWRPSTSLEAMLPAIIDDYVSRYAGKARGAAT